MEIIDAEAGKLLKFSNFDYQGIELTEGGVDASGNEHLHLDVWSATDGKIKLTPISITTNASGEDVPSEHLIEFDVTGGQWNAIDLDLAVFSANGVDLTKIEQIKFAAGTTSVSEFYVDNLAFTGVADTVVIVLSLWRTGGGAFSDLGCW